MTSDMPVCSVGFARAGIRGLQLAHSGDNARKEAPTGPDATNAEGDMPSRIQRLRLRVLIVDDGTAFRESLAFMLRQVYDATVEDVGEASIAMEKLSRGRGFDLILMDVAMPKVNGIEAYKEMRAMGIPSRIALMSAHRENRAKVRALGVPFLDKPLDNEALEKILLECVGGSTS